MRSVAAHDTFPICFFYQPPVKSWGGSECDSSVNASGSMHKFSPWRDVEGDGMGMGKG